MLEKLDSHMQKNITRPLSNTIQKINSKWIKDLNVRPETIKLLEENIGNTSDIHHSRILYDPPPRILEIKAKINKWNLIKIKNLLHNEGNYKQSEKTTFRMGENNSK